MKSMITTVIVSILIYSAAFSQPPSKQWDYRFGGSDEDLLESLQQTSDGGCIAGGYSRSEISGDKTQSNQGFADYWIVKTDANGLKQWDARFGGNGRDQLVTVLQTNDGGYLLGGNSESGQNGDKSQTSRGGADYWIVKTNSSGIKQWDARYGGNENDWLRSMNKTSDSGYILGGFSYSGIGGDKTEDSRGVADYWMVKIDANGNKQWDARFGGSNIEELIYIEQTFDGGYILGGS